MRRPTHELICAAAALQAERTAVAGDASWPHSINGLTALRGIGGVGSEANTDQS